MSTTTPPAPGRLDGPAHPRPPFPHTTEARSSERTQREQQTAELLRRTANVTDDDERRRLLDQVVLLNMCVATAIVSRYRRRGVPDDDLQQVAYLALVKAARGYDPSTGNDFLAYAVPTMRGEVKKYFRDHAWGVRPPRRIQELQSRISLASSELAFELGRSPRPSEVARHLGEDLEAVTEALASDGCFSPTSLDRTVGVEGDATLGDLLGAEDSSRDAAEARVALGPVIRRLSPRDRTILTLRFFHGLTQQEIAQEIGVTQMQVSRLLTRILRDLRADLGDTGWTDPDPAPPSPPGPRQHPTRGRREGNGTG
jgi:RNA polymerase sigma-B factor